jgi:beta-glucanase (GH16 family)
MRKTLFVLAIICVLFATATADRPLASSPQSFDRASVPTQPPQAARIPAAAPLLSFDQKPADYKLVWADEFDGKTLDLSKWDYRGLGPRRAAINVKDCVTLDGEGHLVLTTKRAGKEYHTAMIATAGKFEPLYGYFECRVRFQKQPGHWSAFWLQSPAYGKSIGNVAESGAEIDIFEYLTKFGDSLQHTLHWDGYGTDHKSSKKTADVQGEGWHTIGFLWTPREYVFSVDGRETWRTSEAVSRRAEYIILSLEVGKWAGDIAEAALPDSLLVDYVRVYQRPPDRKE